MSDNNYSKLFGCNVHGFIRVGSMALKIIAAPEFQRMRNIKQLGLCHYVYPAATHTRFEHSIGVYHLAGQMLDKIKKQYPEKYYNLIELGGQTKLTDEIIEYIKLGALCHDIGHGPFSHTFDDILSRNSTHENRYHEARSCLIIDIIFRRELPELSSLEINFVKSIVNPQKKHTGALYQIVTNYLNGIDVDKFDYLARDSLNLGMKNGFDHTRLINEIILDSNDNIAYPKHCATDVYEMFHSRYMMHKKVYSHKTVKLLGVMLSDLFLKIDPVFKISDSIYDMNIFCKLTDDTIFHYIELLISPPPFLTITLDENKMMLTKEAYHIYNNMKSRKLYQQISELLFNAGPYFEKFIFMLTKKFEHVKDTDFKILISKIGFVNGDISNPFNNIFFYDKKENKYTFLLDRNYYSSLLNGNTEEIYSRLICKNRSIYNLVMAEFILFHNKHDGILSHDDNDSL